MFSIRKTMICFFGIFVISSLCAFGTNKDIFYEAITKGNVKSIKVSKYEFIDRNDRKPHYEMKWYAVIDIDKSTKTKEFRKYTPKGVIECRGVLTFDKYGTDKEYLEYDKDNNLVWREIWETTYENDKIKLVNVTLYDKNNIIHHQHKEICNSEGKEIEVLIVDKDNKLFSHEIITYDKEKNTEEIVSIDENGKFKERLVWVYNQFGQRVESYHYDSANILTFKAFDSYSNGKLSETTRYHYYTQKYLPSCYVRKTIFKYYDNAHEEITYIDENKVIERKEYKYDHDNEIKCTVWDENGKVISETQYGYDEVGNMTFKESQYEGERSRTTYEYEYYAE